MIFDDGQGAFTPLTDLRAVFELRTGKHSTQKRIEHLTGLPTQAIQVPKALQAVMLERYPKLAVNTPPTTAGDWLTVNGRCADHTILTQIAQLQSGQAMQLADGTPVAARVNLTDSWDWPQDITVTQLEDNTLLTRVWQIHNLLHKNLVNDIELCQFPMIGRIEDRYHGVTVFGDHAIKVHPSATLQPGVILNSEDGPICIDEDVLVESPTVIQGPCSIGKGSMIAPMTQLRGDTVIGPVCKVGGEIKASIIAGYSNKAHAGYLGNALVGYWVNLGADTTASNLKNTYSPVRMQLAPNLPREDTGLANLGPVIGDYVRTGITTRMPTGTVIGTGTMIAQSTFTPTCVSPMRFITDKADDAYAPDKLIATIKAMMSRRDQQLTDADANRLRDLG